jgi:AcrR family transcriptional regulator
MPRSKPATPPRRRRASEPLSRPRILDVALALADTRGLEAVSMREVARTLGVEAMSLYHHVDGKDGLLDGLVDRVFAEIAVPDATLPWREAIVGRAMSARSVLVRHPWAAALVESRLVPSPHRLRLHDATLGVMRRAGFPIELAYAAYMTLDSYIYGFVLQEVAWPFTEAERPAVIDALAPAIPAAEYPYLHEVMGFVHARGRQDTDQRGDARDFDADFAFGLGLVLDGLERMLLATIRGT